VPLRESTIAASGSSSGEGVIDFERLSPRHRDCLRLVYERSTSKEIAGQLGIGPGTVDGYLAEAIAILGARNRREAAAMLHAHEGLSGPCKLPPQFAGVVQAPESGAVGLSAALPSASPPATTWRHNHLICSKGVPCNGLNPDRRISRIVRVAFSIAASLAAVVFSLESISRLFFSH
jgi:DNA-binding CsgD family transcriptional regulator